MEQKTRVFGLDVRRIPSLILIFWVSTCYSACSWFICYDSVFLRITILFLAWSPRDWKILFKIFLLTSSIKSFCQLVNPYIRRSLSMLVFYIVEHVRFFILMSSSLPYPQLEERPSCTKKIKSLLSHLFVLGELFIFTEFHFMRSLPSSSCGCWASDLPCPYS